MVSRQTGHHLADHGDRFPAGAEADTLQADLGEKLHPGETAFVAVGMGDDSPACARHTLEEIAAVGALPLAAAAALSDPGVVVTGELDHGLNLGRGQKSPYGLGR